MHRRAGGSLALTSNELSLAASTEKLMLDARGSMRDNLQFVLGGSATGQAASHHQMAPDSIYKYSAVLVVVHIYYPACIYINA